MPAMSVIIILSFRRNESAISHTNGRDKVYMSMADVICLIYKFVIFTIAKYFKDADEDEGIYSHNYSWVMF